MDKIIEFSLEQRILHILMLKTFSEKEIGLTTGKMGILLALAQYNKLYPNEIYEDFIDELVDNIWKNIHHSLPVSLSNGLCGIGWGVDFLLYHKILEGFGTELCREIDEKIMQTDPRRMLDKSFEYGLEGVLYYVLAHLQNALTQGDKLPFDTTYLQDLYQAIRKHDIPKGNKRFLNYTQQYIDFHTHRKIPELTFSLANFIEEGTLNDKTLSSHSLGLKHGLAGVLIKKTVSDQRI